MGITETHSDWCDEKLMHACRNPLAVRDIAHGSDTDDAIQRRHEIRRMVGHPAVRQGHIS